MLPSTRAKLDRIEASQDRTEALLTDIAARLARIETTLTTQGPKTMADLTALTASVAANTTVVGSALTLIRGLSAQLAAAGTDPVALAALKTQLDTTDAALAAAVAANTPAAPAPTPAPVPAPAPVPVPAPVAPAPTTSA